MVIDTRPATAYAGGYVPGTINLPLDKAFTTWAGWLLPYDAPFYLLIDEESSSCVHQVTRDLASIGLDEIGGYIGVHDALLAWEHAGHDLDTMPQTTAEEIADSISDTELVVLDVRGLSEWEGGHLPGGRHIPLGYLTDHLAEIPRDRPVVVHCQAGARSAIAVSLLRANGIDRVANLQGGIERWCAAGNQLVEVA
jgi:hydroxyacylglutathione hydrolase